MPHADTRRRGEGGPQRRFSFSSEVSDVHDDNLLHPSSDIEEIERCYTFWPMLRYRIWILFEYPDSSIWAKAISATILFMILVSAAAFSAETLPEYHRRHDMPIWTFVEYLTMVTFTAEYLIRLFAAPSVSKFVKEPLNIIDVFAFLPFYIELAFEDYSYDDLGLAILRSARMIRTFRIFRLSRYSKGVKMFGRSLVMSWNALVLMILFTAMCVIVFATAMYYAERGRWDPERRIYIRQNGDRSPYESIPASSWWAIVTLTTEGYGDLIPITVVGKLICVLAMITGIMIIALPMTIIGLNFSRLYSAEMDRSAKRNDDHRTDVSRPYDDALAFANEMQTQLDLWSRRLAQFKAKAESGRAALVVPARPPLTAVSGGFDRAMPDLEDANMLVDDDSPAHSVHASILDRQHRGGRQPVHDDL